MAIVQQYTAIVCINQRLTGRQACCASRGGEAIAHELELLLAEYGFAGCVRRVECLGECEKGPNLRIAPGERFYHGVTLSDLPEVRREFLRLASAQREDTQ